MSSLGYWVGYCPLNQLLARKLFSVVQVVPTFELGALVVGVMPCVLRLVVDTSSLAQRELSPKVPSVTVVSSLIDWPSL